jgi:hypothetical protein
MRLFARKFWRSVHRRLSGLRQSSSGTTKLSTWSRSSIASNYCEPVRLPEARARRYIKPAGVLLIEVPDAELNPFDLVVADHASHFSKNSLARVTEAAGYEVLACRNAVIDNEITLVARPIPADKRAHPPDQADAGLARRNLAWLERTLDQAHALAKEKEAFGVFGTSIAGLWIGSALAKQIRFFVDEDEARIGRDYFGTPILAPSQVPVGATVFVCLEPKLSQAIAARHADPSRNYVPTEAVA